MNNSTNNDKIIASLIIISVLINLANSAINSLALSNPNINAISSYTFSITFSGPGPYSPLTLTFPQETTILANCTVRIGGVTQSITIVNTSTLIVTSSNLTTSTTIIVNNVLNPISAITSSSFSYSNSIQTSILSSIQQIGYTPGSLASCPWTFSLCTEQTNSDLQVAITTVNPLPKGSNTFIVKYATNWANSYTKGLMWSVTSTTCSYNTNGSFITSNVTCIIDTSNNKITIYYYLANTIATGTNMVFKISGINSPPTKQTTTSSQYSVSTADYLFNSIDTLSSCQINNVCVANYSDSTFSNTVMPVNSIYSNPFILYSTPVNITNQQLDAVDIYFSPISSLTTCSSLRISRNSVISLSTIGTYTNYVTYQYPNGIGSNSVNNTAYTLFLTCTAFQLPPSQTPSSLLFKFKRSGSEYLQLTATFNPTATIFNSNNGILTISSTQMGATPTFSFNFVIGQPLTNNPGIKLTFHSDFTISSPNCSVSVLGRTVNASSCNLISGSIVYVNFTVSSNLASGSNITIIILGITNSLSPISYNVQMDTYYDNAISSSRVQTSASAFIANMTAITNYNVTLLPKNLVVFSTIPITLSFKTIVDLPALSTFSIQFPSGVSSLVAPSNLMTVNNSPATLTATPTITNLTLVSFSINTNIPLNSSIIITIQLVTPSIINIYSYVTLVVSNNGNNYLTSTNSMYLNVDQIASMPINITSNSPQTGGQSSYTVGLTLSIPHSSSFILQVEVPSDTQFISTSFSCTNCSSGLSPINGTAFSFIATNPYPNQTSVKLYFQISTFINPRVVGSSLLWTIITKTLSSNVISSQQASAVISLPNVLSGYLSTTDSYYKNNTNSLKMYLTFKNSLINSDYIQWSTTSNIYSQYSSITCSSIFGTCTSVGTTAGVLVVNITPNQSSIVNNVFYVVLQGLISGSNSQYNYPYSISVKSFNSASSLIDQGTIIYQVSCGANVTKACRTCYSNNICIDCYVSDGFYLSNGSCVSQCGPPTNYYSYANNVTGSCTSCINNCFTCSSATVCTSCISGYYFYTSDYSCQLLCQTTNGFYIVTNAGSKFCSPCVSGCLQCINSSNTCTRCNNVSLLISGSCQTTCGSTSLYQLNGNCYDCDVSCYNCSGSGSGSCYMCNSDYHSYQGFCISVCPSGTAIHPITGNCGCDPKCSKCSNYSTCTLCANSSLWVYNGNCVISCPGASYQSSGNCFPCSTGCLNCTINTCSLCLNTSFLYNNLCYGDCNFISFQYDKSGTTCVLCPDGCDTCLGTVCTSCLSQYSYSSSTSQCTKTCILNNNCAIDAAQVLPLPGMITLVVWSAIVLILRLFQNKNFIPYSIMMISAIIEFILLLGLVSSVQSVQSSRLLTFELASRNPMRILLGFSIALNYLCNFAYILIFLKYIKPLISNPRQIDVISNIVVLVVATCTNYRFALIAFARIFPKPSIYIENSSKLTPIHYLCLCSLFLDIMPIVAGGLGVINQQSRSNPFMLSVDLLIMIAVNIVITIWFVARDKPEQYYKGLIQKYSAEEGHQPTGETLPNQKNTSKGNIMIANESFNNTEILDHTNSNSSGYYDSYKKLKYDKNKISKDDEIINGKVITNSKSDDDYIFADHKLVTVQSKKQHAIDIQDDPNYQQQLKNKRSNRSVNNSQKDFQGKLAQTLRSQGKSNQDSLSAKNRSASINFSKQPIKSERKPLSPQKDIQQVEESDFQDLDEVSNKDRESVFEGHKNKISKPKRVGTEKEKVINKMTKAKLTNKNIDQPLKIMKKDKNIGYFESDAFESNVDEQDIQAIIKQKVFQSTIRLEKPKDTHLESNQQTGYQEISPSRYNYQNQRLDLSDFQDQEPQ